MKRPNVPVQGQGFVQPEISQNDILIRHKAESRIDSRLFAERIGIKHKSLYSLIQKHKPDCVNWVSFRFKRSD